MAFNELAVHLEQKAAVREAVQQSTPATLQEMLQEKGYITADESMVISARRNSPADIEVAFNRQGETETRPDGSKLIYDKEGKEIAAMDKSGNWILSGGPLVINGSAGINLGGGAALNENQAIGGTLALTEEQKSIAVNYVIKNGQIEFKLSGAVMQELAEAFGADTDMTTVGIGAGAAWQVNNALKLGLEAVFNSTSGKELNMQTLVHETGVTEQGVTGGENSRVLATVEYALTDLVNLTGGVEYSGKQYDDFAVADDFSRLSPYGAVQLHGSFGSAEFSSTANVAKLHLRENITGLNAEISGQYPYDYEKGEDYRGAAIDLRYPFANGWGVEAGASHREYDENSGMPDSQLTTDMVYTNLTYRDHSNTVGREKSAGVKEIVRNAQRKIEGVGDSTISLTEQDKTFERVNTQSMELVNGNVIVYYAGTIVGELAVSGDIQVNREVANALQNTLSVSGTGGTLTFVTAYGSDDNKRYEKNIITLYSKEAEKNRDTTVKKASTPAPEDKDKVQRPELLTDSGVITVGEEWPWNYGTSPVPGTFEITDSSIVSVTGGEGYDMVIKGLKEGKTTVLFTSDDENLAAFEVTVTVKPETSKTPEVQKNLPEVQVSDIEIYMASGSQDNIEIGQITDYSPDYTVSFDYTSTSTSDYFDFTVNNDGKILGQYNDSNMADAGIFSVNAVLKDNNGEILSQGTFTVTLIL